jgi:hypothetical protein
LRTFIVVLFAFDEVEQCREDGFCEERDNIKALHNHCNVSKTNRNTIFTSKKEIVIEIELDK